MYTQLRYIGEKAQQQYSWEHWECHQALIQFILYLHMINKHGGMAYNAQWLPPLMMITQFKIEETFMHIEVNFTW